MNAGGRRSGPRRPSNLDIGLGVLVAVVVHKQPVLFLDSNHLLHPHGAEMGNIVPGVCVDTDMELEDAALLEKCLGGPGVGSSKSSSSLESEEMSTAADVDGALAATGAVGGARPAGRAAPGRAVGAAAETEALRTQSMAATVDAERAWDGATVP